jgi:OTU domain-containing protein 3
MSRKFSALSPRAPELWFTLFESYHDWEHFSSIRSLRGPHSGLPNVRETGAPPPEPEPEPKPSSRPTSKRGGPSKIKLKLSAPKEASSSARLLPTDVPLPPSRSHSPLPDPRVIASAVPPGLTSLDVPRLGTRSPKRSFDESSETSGSSQSSSSKRSRTMSSLPNSSDSQLPSSSSLPHDLSPLTTDSEDNEDEDSSPARTTPYLSPASSASLSTSSLSSLSPSPELEDRLPTPPPPPPEPQLTKRQRKRLGLPRNKQPLQKQQSAGKIVIPGGRLLRSQAKQVTVKQEEVEVDVGGEWQNNGNGRVDVRGFRELKI